MFPSLQGRSYCDWSSCQEGCTKTVYTCWQVTVEYEIPGINPGSDIPKSSITAKGKLYPNVKVVNKSLYRKKIIGSTYIFREIC